MSQKFPRFDGARLIAIVAIILAVLAPATALAQQQGPGTLWWNEDGGSFATFGPNASVTIDTGFISPGNCDFIFPAAKIWVVNVSSMANGANLTDVSNGQGLPNVVQAAGGGIFISESIAFTKPDGFLGPGTYGVVYDECEDGVFNAGVDTFFYPAFEVVIPADIGPLPPSSIGALKAAAQSQADRWATLIGSINAIEKLIEIKDTIECISGGIAGCLASMAIDKFKEFIINSVMDTLGLVDPKEAAKDNIVDTVGHYGGIAADPPDPNFQQPDVLEPITLIPANSTDPVINAVIGVGNAQATQQAILGALLHAMERYQGADIADDAPWALVHARAMQSLSVMLTDQIGASNAALTALDAALTADPRNFDAGFSAAAPLLAQIVSSGFSPEQVQVLVNAGASTAQMDALRSSIAGEGTVFTEAQMHAAIAALLAGNADLLSVLATLITDLDGNIVTLVSPPNLPPTFPVANAGGPYTGAEGSAIALSAAASSDPDGTIASYAWDLDRDGQFDDAVGVAPSHVFPAAFTGFVGVQVTDNNGHIAVAYALVSLTEVNGAPVATAMTPADTSLSIPAGTSQAFSITATDPDGDALTARWTVDFVEVAGASSLSHSISFDTLGQHTVRVEVSDGLPAGGSVMHQWTVTVVAIDADGDGWNSNVDCNDGNAAVHPYGPEIIGNGVDDDCRADTLDGGTPPSAGFTHAPAPALVGQTVTFTNTSVDPDFSSLLYAWSFGDGGTSTLQNPTHAYATAGTFTVSLTVTDPQSFTSTATGSVVVTRAPTASFTFSPNPGVRELPVAFLNTSSDPDGPLASYQWSFGDGGISSDPNPSHTYDTAGTFAVQLIVTDGDGLTASHTQSITINPAPTDVTSLKFVIYETNCGWVPTYNMKIGGVTVASMTAASDCTCTPAAKTVTITDPAILAMVSSPVCQVFDVESLNNVYYFGSAHVEITRPTGVQRVRIVNTNGSDGPDVYSGYACSGFIGGPVNYHSQLPNLDGDAVPDCTDPDIDGDSVDNAADNCALIANPTQADFNSNGVGDACEDSDGDTLIDAADNCQAIANTNQWDFDRDNIRQPVRHRCRRRRRQQHRRQLPVHRQCGAGRHRWQRPRRRVRYQRTADPGPENHRGLSDGLAHLHRQRPDRHAVPGARRWLLQRPDASGDGDRSGSSGPARRGADVQLVQDHPRPQLHPAVVGEGRDAALLRRRRHRGDPRQDRRPVPAAGVLRVGTQSDVRQRHAGHRQRRRL